MTSAPTPLLADIPEVAEASSSAPPEVQIEPTSYAPAQRWTVNHPIEQILGDPNAGVQTRRSAGNICLFVNFISLIEPKKTDDALKYPNWVSAMQEELT